MIDLSIIKKERMNHIKEKVKEEVLEEILNNDNKDEKNKEENKDEDDYSKIKDLLYEGKNIFLTGPGGVGKSYYIKKLKEELGDTITITSTTGVSSFNLKGQTIHSFSGIGAITRRDKVDHIIKKIYKKGADEKIKNCKILVIDEVSMLGQFYLETIDRVFRHVRRNDNALGGVQVIFTGDFLQLPPINDEFCFNSPVWNSLKLQTIYLKKMYRVKDPVYTQLLERVRVAKHTTEDNKTLYKRVFAYNDLDIDYNQKDKIQPTFLYGKKVNVEEKNMEELELNDGELLIFKPKFMWNDMSRKDKDLKLIEDRILENILYLKIGAQIMLTVNISVEEGLVNGSRGVVIDYDKETKMLKVKFLDGRVMDFSTHEFVYTEDNDKPYYTITQFPFILAYALSIHKVQGCTLDYAVIDLGYSIFEASMSYVALSRVRSIEGLFLKAFQSHKIFCNKDALEFYENLEKK